MNNYIIHNGELYHYGVKGMKWGVRRSAEVQGVNRQYKSELKGLKKEYHKQKGKNAGKHVLNSMVLGRKTANITNAFAKHKARKDFKSKKRELQEKYEPDFQKAKKEAEARLNTPEAKAARAKKIATGKKIAGGVLAGVGATVLTTSAVLAFKNKDSFKVGMQFVKAAQEMKKWNI